MNQKLLTVPETNRRHHVVIVGSGFGGLFAAKALRRHDVDVTVISRTTHHLFQPLLYQVATGILSEGEIAPATREILRRHPRTRVVLGDVVDLDPERRTVVSVVDGTATLTPYDSLIVAAGAQTAYFGHDRYAEHAPGLKTIEDALDVRRRIYGAFERAELANTPEERERLTTFVVVGAGATGVELAGQVSELARRTLRRDFRQVDPAQAHVVLVDAGDQVLGAFGAHNGAAARRKLEKMGVDVRLRTAVEGIDADGVTLRIQSGPGYRLPAGCTIWAAGVVAAPLAGVVADRTGVAVDRAGRVRVQADLTLPGYPEIFVVGDMACVGGVAGVAQGAIQEGRFAARTIVRRQRGDDRPRTFHYFDKGTMAAISHTSAVVAVRGIRFSGFIAWLMWLALHLFYLVGFRNRVTTLLHWAISFLGHGRAERTVAQPATPARVERGEVAS